MRKYIGVMIVLVAMFGVVGVADAGVFDSIKTAVLNLISVETIINIVLGIAALVGGGLFAKAKTTLKETGNFIDAVSTAVDDNKVTNEEVKAILMKKDDVISIWKKTPEQFKE